MALRRAFAALLLLAGCGPDDDRPLAEEPTISTAMASTEDDGGSHLHPFCVAGDRRQCKVFWTSRDQPGVQHCTVTTQVCRDDGRGWRPCGED